LGAITTFSGRRLNCAEIGWRPEEVPEHVEQASVIPSECKNQQGEYDEAPNNMCRSGPVEFVFYRSQLCLYG
jgi:hypothetical protein